MAEEIKASEQPKVVIKDITRPKKSFHAMLYEDDAEDVKLLRLLSIAKTVGGVSTKRIVELGLKAYIQTADFKEKAKAIKDIL